MTATWPATWTALGGDGPEPPTFGVDAGLNVAAAHAIAVDAEHRLIHAVSRLTAALVHADPDGDHEDHHAESAHHRDP